MTDFSFITAHQLHLEDSEWSGNSVILKTDQFLTSLSIASKSDEN